MFVTFPPINMAFTKISELLKYNAETSVVICSKKIASRELFRLV